MNQLSGYHYMWIMVMFDLPVIEKEDRKAATDFRKTLLDNGFMMSQYSVYMRFCGKREKLPKYINIIHSALPLRGKVSILTFTDKEYDHIITFNNRKKYEEKTTNQLTIFDL